MSRNILISAGDQQFTGKFYDTPTAEAILQALPIQSYGQRWGGEIYFTIGVTAVLETNSRDVLEAGELGYWPTGRAFCIFFGPTPASNNEQIRAASNVNILGKITSDLSGLWSIATGEIVRIEKE